MPSGGATIGMLAFAISAYTFDHFKAEILGAGGNVLRIYWAIFSAVLWSLAFYFGERDNILGSIVSGAIFGLIFFFGSLYLYPVVS